MVNGHDQRAIFVRTADSPDPAKLVLVGSSVLLSTDAEVIHLGDIQRGDRVDAVGIPSPDRAYPGNRLRDLDLAGVSEQTGSVVRWDAAHGILTIRVTGGGEEEVPIGPSTRIGVPESLMTLKAQPYPITVYYTVCAYVARQGIVPEGIEHFGARYSLIEKAMERDVSGDTRPYV